VVSSLEDIRSNRTVMAYTASAMAAATGTVVFDAPAVSLAA
jgi:hypothetical protein